MARRRTRNPLPTTRPHRRSKPPRLPTDVPSGVALAPGTRLGRYTVLTPIAAGGGGSVYRARDEDLGREVALKVLDERLVSPAMAARMQREAELSARLAHPHLIRVHEAGAVRGPNSEPLRFIAMALVEGGTLADALDDDDCDLTERVALLAQAARGVGHAHAHGVIHRDLKPANVLIDDAGRAIVADFGLARDDGPSDLTATGVAMGTVHYMSPEQVRGDKDRVGPPSDVWALGVILHEALVGELPFDGPVPATVYRAILGDEPRVPRSVRGGPGAALVPVLRKALDKRPEARYADGAALAEELERWLGGEAPVASRSGATSFSRISRIVHVNRGRLGALVAAVAILSVLLTVGAMRWLDGRRADRMWADLQTAQDAGRTREALSIARQLLVLRDTPELRLVARTLRDQLEREGRETTDRARQDRERAALEARLAPLQRRLVGLREQMYIAGADVPRQLAEVRAEIARLAARSGEPAARRSARFWTVLGTARALIGRPAEAERSLARALELTPDDPALNTALGRVTLQLALLALTTDDDRPTMLRESRQLCERGLTYLRRGERSWDRAGELEQRTARAYLAMAAGDPARVVSICEEAIARFGARSPGAERFWGLLGICQTDPAKRLTCLRHAVSVRPHDVLLLISLGYELAVTGRHDEAIAVTTRALALDPGSVEALANRGAVYERHDLPGKAIEDLTRLTEIAPRYVRGWLSRGVAHVRLGQLDEAARAYARARELAPRSPVLHFNLAMLAHRRGDSAAMLAGLDRAIALRPDYPEALINRGRAHLRAKRFRQAEADLDRAVAAAPDNVLARGKRAILRLRTGRLREAIADLDHALTVQPEYLEARVNRGVMHERAGAFDKALADYTIVTQLAPRDASAWSNRGNALRALRRFREAIDDYTRAARLAPRDPRPLVSRGLCKLALGDGDGAGADYDAALARDARHAAAYRYRAELRDRQKRYDEAIADYTRALALVPGAALLLTDRALVYLRVRKNALAKADIDAALAAEPRYWKAHFGRGLLRLAAGDGPGAAAALRQARALAPAAVHPAIDQLLAKLK